MMVLMLRNVRRGCLLLFSSGPLCLIFFHLSAVVGGWQGRSLRRSQASMQQFQPFAQLPELKHIWRLNLFLDAQASLMLVGACRVAHSS